MRIVQSGFEKPLSPCASPYDGLDSLRNASRAPFPTTQFGARVRRPMPNLLLR